MIRGPSVSLQLSLTLVVALVIVLGIHSLVVIGLPPPPTTLQSIQQTAEALRDPARAVAYGLESRLQAVLPGTMEEGPLAGALAQILGVAPTQVRTAWADGRKSLSIRRVGEDADGIEAQLPQALLMVPALPAFAAALQEPSGHWRVVAPVRPWLTPWQRQLLASFVLSALLLIPLAGWAASRLTRPLRALGHAAASLDLSSPPEQIPITGSREARQLGQALRAAMQRWRQQSEERVQLIAAIAHDLRTPLTGLRLRLDPLPEVQREPLLADLVRIEQMVTRALEYVHSDQDALQREPVDLGELAEDAVRCAEAAGQVVVWRGADGPAALIEADALALHRAVGNLLENAARYAGACEVWLRAEAGAMVLTVADRGPGIPAECVDALLQPFQRGDRARSARGGFGLGLSIAATIARRHGGALQLRPRPGGGLCAALWLPCGGVHLNDSEG
jgi:signal transduction histidine kinase